MRFLIIDTCYNAFLNAVYARYSDLDQQSYNQQLRTLMDQCFGTADYYSSNLHKLGHEAKEVISNCLPMQLRWAQDHALRIRYKLHQRNFHGLPIPWLKKMWFYTVLLEQVKDYRPDVIHFQDPGGIDPTFLREIRPYVRLITAQIACPIPSGTNFKEYDLMLSALPYYVERFKQLGIESFYFKLGFEPNILNYLKKEEVKLYNVVFIGGFSSSHVERIHYLEQLSQQIHVDWWGYGVECFSRKSPMRVNYHGEAWGLEMYEILSKARISINYHGDLAGEYAVNMRLYESTGVGSMLLTDAKKNLQQLFEPGIEIVPYSSINECIELAKYYNEHENERRSIAYAGQQRTFLEHTYYKRMEEFIEIVLRYL